MPTIDTLMTSPPVTATAGEPLADAVRRMHDHRVGSVVVMEGNRAVGIVTERDVLRATAAPTSDTTTTTASRHSVGMVGPRATITGQWMR